MVASETGDLASMKSILDANKVHVGEPIRSVLSGGE